MSLVLELRKTLANNLIRRASEKCSDWSENYIILGKPVPGPMRFRRFPWEREWVNNDRSWAGRKAAQMGMTNAALLRSIYNIDIKRIGVLYILPKKTPDAADFSRTKFDSLLELSPHLRELFSNVRNIGHKQAGASDLFIRGARSRSGLKSISVGAIVYDEYDEMPQKNVSLAEERSSGYEESDKHEIKISTPTVPEFGIDVEYGYGTQKHFKFRCLRCNRWTELDSLDQIKITADDAKDPKIKNSYIETNCCHQELPHAEKPDFFERNEWVSTANHDAPLDTYWIPQLYSTTLAPWRIARSILRAKVDPAEEQELMNSKMGLPHVVEGAQVDDKQINDCQKPYTIPFPPPPMGIITMGVDVGKVLHVEIDQWFLPAQIGKDLNTYAIPKVIHQTITKDFEELDKLMVEWNISHCVVDYEPETRKANEFKDRFFGKVHLAYPHRGLAERQITIKAESHAVGFRRTSWLDLSQGRFRRQAIHLPRNISVEYREAIKALARIEKKNDDGDLIAKYISRKADHEAFARLYNELALVFAVSGRENRDVGIYL